MKTISIDDREKIIPKIEDYIRESYSNSDYLRCYNLIKLLYKLDKGNEVAIKYYNRLDPKIIEKARKKWTGLKTIADIFKNPKFYISLAILIWLWQK